MGTILMPFMRRSAPEALKPRTRLATEAFCRPWRLSISSNLHIWSQDSEPPAAVRSATSQPGAQLHCLGTPLTRIQA